MCAERTRCGKGLGFRFAARRRSSLDKTVANRGTKTLALAAVLALALAGGAAASEKKIYYWKTSSNDFLSFTDPANWVMGTSASGEAATDYPGGGDDDWLHYTTGYANGQYMDMGGQSVSVRGVDYTDATLQYGQRGMGVRNGSLTFTSAFRTRQVKMTVYSGGTFATAASCALTTEWGGALNLFTVKSGGVLSLAGTMSIGNLRVTVEAGGTATVAPESFTLTDQGAATVEAWFDNSGMMSFPNGLTIGATGKYGAGHGCAYPFIQKSGTMTVGGPIAAADGTTLYNDFSFDLRGGTLAVTGDVSMPLFGNAVGMLTEGAAATVDIAAGKTLDWSNATFADATTLNVTGAGTLVLGSSYPATLNLAEGVTLGLGGTSADLHTVTGVDGANFVVPSAACVFRNQTLVRSGDAATVAAIAAKLTCGKEGWSSALADGQIRLSWSTEPRQFIWKGQAALCSFFDVTKWSTSWDETSSDWGASAWSNDEGLVPGENDFWLYGLGGNYRKFHFDMGGATYRVGGLFGDGGLGAANAWYAHDALVTNGTLEIVHTFTNYYVVGTVKPSGRFTLARTSVSRLGKDGACNSWTVEDGGEIRYLGAIQVNNAKVNVASGGLCVLDPTAFDFDAGTRDDIGCGVFSEGTLEIPHGLAMGSVNASSAVTEARQPWWTIRSSGALVLGGDVTFTPSGTYGIGKVCFDVQGGTVSVTDDAAFSGLEAVTFTNGAVSVSVAAGATFALTNATFGSGVTLSASGAGAVMLGTAFPETLALDEGVTVSFAQGGATFGTITGAEKAKFTVGPGIRRRTVIAESDDATLLNAIAANFVSPEGRDLVALVDGRQLIVRRTPKGSLLIVR